MKFKSKFKCTCTRSLSFFFSYATTTVIYTLSHTTLFRSRGARRLARLLAGLGKDGEEDRSQNGYDGDQDRKSTRLNSSHGYISYAVFCSKTTKAKLTSEVSSNVLILPCLTISYTIALTSS